MRYEKNLQKEKNRTILENFGKYNLESIKKKIKKLVESNLNSLLETYNQLITD